MPIKILGDDRILKSLPKKLQPVTATICTSKYTCHRYIMTVNFEIAPLKCFIKKDQAFEKYNILYMFNKNNNSL